MTPPPDIAGRLRVAAIDFLNPAPLMWDFEHEPGCSEMARRYVVHRTEPSRCAAQLVANEADIGLIPVAAIHPGLRVVPGCVIASLEEVRSILLLVRQRSARSLEEVRTVAADTASRSSLAYVEVLFRHFLHRSPAFLPRSADPFRMLDEADAALLIGDPALLAREHRAAIETAHGPCLWIDVAAEWHRYTALPWVAAIWAVRPEALSSQQDSRGITAAQVTLDLQRSRDRGLANIDTLVREWTPRIALPPSTIRTYLTQNIHYRLDERCLDAIRLFRQLAATVDALPPLPEIPMLAP